MCEPSSLNENERHCSIATRNQRLGSIHALARFIGAHSPQHVEWCTRVRMVPIKKGVATSVTYLEKAEVEALLAAPIAQRASGRAITPCCCSFTTPVSASVKRHRSGSVTSIGTGSPFESW